MVEFVSTNAYVKQLLEYREICLRRERDQMREIAFASVNSLKNTIERLLKSCRISLVPPSPQIIEIAYEEVQSLQELLKRSDGGSRRVSALDGKIRDAVCRFEDVLESHLSNQIVSQSESQGGGTHLLLFSINLQDLKQDVDSFIEMVKRMKEECIKEIDNPLPGEEEEEEEEEEEALSSRIDFGEKKPKMVGFSNLLSKIRDSLIRDEGLTFSSLVGMAGIGKTTLAKKIFEDPLIESHFECRAWVTAGRKYQLKEMARGILAQVEPNMDKMLMEGDEEIADYLYESLKGKRYFIVLDDIWDKQVCDYLTSSFPNDRRSRILLTTRLKKLADSYSLPRKMSFLNNKESWDLLCEKVFGKDSCPPQLEKAGKKIAMNCEGLPLTIVTVANILSKAKRTPEYWNEVAENKTSIFMDAYDEMYKVLISSYEHLSQNSKLCFLYMGVFLKKREIPASRLINLLSVEGFLEPPKTQTLEDCAMECLEELASNNLVICRMWRNENVHLRLRDCLKTCRLHSSLWHLCHKETRKNKFFHVLNNRVDGKEAIKIQRRLCVHNNILFGNKDLYNSIEDDCASTARSLLCFGPYHRYPVPICFGLRLLRVLDARNIRLYQFPMEVLKLVHLRYLALTYSGNLPTSVPRLFNLQFLIIHRHLSIKSCGAPLYIPAEIWDMQELKLLQVTGSDLPNPNCGTSLQNLFSLSSVSAHSCTKQVLKRIPNLKKLRIQIKLVPGDDSKPFGRLNRIYRLRKLEELRCDVMNPELKFEIVTPPAPRSMFPSSLQKLQLSGLGYPWEYMNIIGSLKKLKVLELRCFAFRGPEWEMQENSFHSLEFLLIEDTDLVRWKVAHKSHLWRDLIIKHCYKLEQLHWESNRYPLMIEVVDCNPLAVTCVKQIKSRGVHIRSYSSWGDLNLKS